jgi:Tol biopolymer transport system component
MRWIPLLALCVAMPAALHAADAPKGKIVYSRKDGEKLVLHVMNADGTGDHLLPGQTENLNVFPSWSPDGKRIAFTAASKLDKELNNGDAKIAIINADGTGLKTVNIPGKMALFPCWSPDGRQLVFTGGEGQPSAFVVDTDGNGLRQLNPDGTGAFLPFWFHDGKRIGYAKFQPQVEATELVTVNPDGTNEESLLKSDRVAVAGEGGLSGDDQRLLYLAVHGGQDDSAELRIWDRATKGEMFLTDVKLGKVGGPAEFPSPAWAPDGKSFIVVLPTEKGRALFRISDDGKSRTRLTPEGVDCVGGSWTGKG